MLFALPVCLPAQSHWVQQHTDAAYQMMTAATMKLNEGRHTEAAMLASEAFDEMSFGADPEELTSAALLLFRIAESAGNASKSLEHLFTALVVSENAQPDYRQSALLSAVSYFDTHGLTHRNAELIEEALVLNKGDQDIEIKLLECMVRSAYAIKDTERAIAALEDLCAIARLRNNRESQRRTLVALGLLHYQDRKTDKALVLFEELRGLAATDASTMDLAIALNNIALCKQEQQDFGDARKLFADALLYCPKNTAQYCEILLNSAFLEKRLGEAGEARQLVEMAITSAEKNKDYRLIAKTKLLLASLWDADGDRVSAIDLSKTAAAMAMKHDFSDLAEECYQFAMKLYTAMNDRANAQYCSEQIILIGKNRTNDLSARTMKKDTADFELSQLDKLARAEWNQLTTRKLEREKAIANEFTQEKALELMRTEQELMKSEFNRTQVEREKAQRELALAQTSLLSQQQATSIVALEKSKTAQMLEMVNLKLESETKENQLQLAQQKNQLLTSEAKLKDERVRSEQAAKRLSYLAGGFSVLALIVAAFVIRRMRSTNKTIAQQHENLNAANREVMESILSARNFQASIIPKEDKVKKLVSDAFIYYEPMDVVSGDLPFVTRKGNKLFIAAIDCIGHGVSAAMLTFITHFNLKQIIEEQIHLPVGDMLKMLHDRLVATMKEHAETQGFLSGIDISFCIIDLPSREIQFAGAQLPLLIQTGQGMEKLKGDPYSVGDLYLDSSPNFKTQRRELLPGDRIFLLSDGFIHQMGGPTGKNKFSLKKLISALESASGKPMSQIKQLLKEAYDNWKGDHPQTDDVMVLGVTIR